MKGQINRRSGKSLSLIFYYKCQIIDWEMHGWVLSFVFRSPSCINKELPLCTMHINTTQLHHQTA